MGHGPPRWRTACSPRDAARSVQKREDCPCSVRASPAVPQPQKPRRGQGKRPRAAGVSTRGEESGWAHARAASDGPAAAAGDLLTDAELLSICGKSVPGSGPSLRRAHGRPRSCAHAPPRSHLCLKLPRTARFLNEFAETCRQGGASSSLFQGTKAGGQDARQYAAWRPGSWTSVFVNGSLVRARAPCNQRWPRAVV